MPEKQTKVRVTLLVNASAGDLGVTGAVGDEVEVDAETAARWIAAGIAEKAGGADTPAEETPAEEPNDKPAGPTGRRR